MSERRTSDWQMVKLERTRLPVGAVLGILLGAASAGAQTGPDTWSEPPVTTVPATFSSGGGLAGSGDGFIYALHGFNTARLSRYTIGTNRWTSMAPAPATISYGGAIVRATLASTEYLYAFRGNSTAFYRYTVGTNSWTTMSPAPAPTHLGAALVWDGGGYLYALLGNNTKEFRRYSLAGDSWESLPPTLETVYSGGCLAWDGTYVYALRGNSTRTFWRYTVGGSWKVMDNALGSVGDGATLAWDKQNSIYALLGNGTAESWKYTIGGTWTMLSPSPAAHAGGSSLYYPGTGDFVYATQGNSTGFLRYCLSSAAWSTLTAKPTSISAGGAMVSTQNGSLYALRGNVTTDFWRWTVGSNDWFPMAPIPAAAGSGAALAWNGGDLIYAFRGNGATDFYQYSIAGDKWTARHSTLASVQPGAALSRRNGPFLYALRGNPYSTFWQYDIGADSWSSVAPAPGTVALGASLVWDGVSSIYALRGGSTSFWRFDSSGNWTTLAAAPETVGDGGALVYPGSGAFIYALQGGNATGFMRYSIAGNSWVSLSPTPDTIYGGGAISYPGTGDTLYALRGNATNDVWSYRIGSDSWTPIAPSVVSSGGALASDGTYLYALRGSVTQEFWRYRISTRTWTPLAWTPSPVYSGGALAWGGGNYLYAFRGNTTTDFWRYDIAGNSWSSLPAAPGTISDGGSLVWTGASHNYIYALRGGNQLDFWRFDISTGTWEARTSVQSAANYGAGLVWDGGNSLYALRGNDSSDVWKFDLANNSWTPVAPSPEAIGAGGALAYAAGALYAFKGSLLTSQANVFLRYTFGGWSTVANAPESVSFGSALVYPGSGSYLYALRGNTSRHFWRYQFQTADATAPTAGTVYDGAAADVDWQKSTSSISANWAGFADSESGIARYEWAIGTTPGGTDIQPFVGVGTATSAAAVVALSDGSAYYVTVRATNGEGLSTTVWSDGVTVSLPVPAETTPAAPGTVRDGTGDDIDIQSSTDTIFANWSGFSLPGGIQKYEWAVGTAPGKEDILEFADVGTATSATAVGRKLQVGRTYYTTVRASNDNQFFAVALSDGVKVVRLTIEPHPMLGPATWKELASAERIPVNPLRISAMGSEDLLISALRFRASGTGEVELFLDVDRNGLLDPATDQPLDKARRLTSDGEVVAFENLRLLVPGEQSRDVLVAYSLTGASLPGASFRISLEDVAAFVKSTGEAIPSSSAFPLAGREALVVAPGTVGVLYVEPGSATQAPGKAAPGESSVVLTQIQLHAASVEAVSLSGLKVHLVGNAEGAISAVRLAVDVNENGIYDSQIDVVLDGAIPAPGAESVAFAFPTQTIPAGENGKWLVTADVSATAAPGESLGVYVGRADFVASGTESMLQIVPDGDDVTGPERKVDPGAASLTIWNHPLPVPGIALPFGRNVAVLGFDARVGGAQGLFLRQVRVRCWGTGDEPSDVRFATLWRGDRAVAFLESPFSIDDGEMVFVLNEWLPAGTTELWKVTLDFAGWSASGKEFQLYFDVDPSSVVAATAAGEAVSPSGGLVIGWWTPVQPLDGSEDDSRPGCLGSVTARPFALGCFLWVLLVVLILRRGGVR